MKTGLRKIVGVLILLLVAASVMMVIPCTAADLNSTPVTTQTTKPPDTTPSLTETLLPTATPSFTETPRETTVSPTVLPTTTAHPTSQATRTLSPGTLTPQVSQIPTPTPNLTQNQTVAPTIPETPLPPVPISSSPTLFPETPLPTQVLTTQTPSPTLTPTPTKGEINQSSFDDILAEYNEQIAQEPLNAKLWFRKGFFLQANRMYESALTSYENAIRIAPDYKEAMYNRGVCLEALHDFPGALAAYDQTLLLDPQYSPVIASRNALLTANPELAPTIQPTPTRTLAVNATSQSPDSPLIYGIAGGIVIVSIALLALILLYVKRYGRHFGGKGSGGTKGSKKIRTRTIAQTERQEPSTAVRTRTALVVDITSIRTRLLRDSDIDAYALESTIAIAIELSREGREGKAIGTSFVIGDALSVLAKSRQLILNPLEGHPREERLITNPDLRENIKELALIDGAFVISGDGVVEAAGRYITVDTSDVTLPPGLGTRHASIAAITLVTEAVGIVVSESGGTLTFFKNGEIVGSIR